MSSVCDRQKGHSTCAARLHHTCKTMQQLLETGGLTYAEPAGTPAPADVWGILDKWTVDGGWLSTKLQYYTKPCWLEEDVHQSDKLFEELYLEAEMRLMAAFACMTHRKCGSVLLLSLSCLLPYSRVHMHLALTMCALCCPSMEICSLHTCCVLLAVPLA